MNGPQFFAHAAEHLCRTHAQYNRTTSANLSICNTLQVNIRRTTHFKQVRKCSYSVTSLESSHCFWESCFVFGREWTRFSTPRPCTPSRMIVALFNPSEQMVEHYFEIGYASKRSSFSKTIIQNHPPVRHIITWLRSSEGVVKQPTNRKRLHRHVVQPLAQANSLLLFCSPYGMFSYSKIHTSFASVFVMINLVLCEVWSPDYAQAHLWATGRPLGSCRLYRVKKKAININNIL
jgi:hypothetical protein